MKEFKINKGYRAIVIASILSGIGDSLYNIVFVIYASRTPFKTIAVSLASMANIIPGLLEFITGYFADETQKKVNGMIVIKMIQSLLFLILSVVIVLPKSFTVFLILLLINIVSDTVGQYANGLQLPIIKSLIPREEMNGAMGLMNASHTTIQLVFQGVGASVIVLLNYNFFAFGLINAMTFLVACLVLFKNRSLLTNSQSEIVKQKKFENMGLVFKEAFGYLFHEKSKLLAMIFLGMISNFFAASLEGLMNLSLLTTKNLYFFNYGMTIVIFFGFVSVGSILGAFIDNDIFKNVDYLTLISIESISIAFLGFNFFIAKSKILISLSLFVTGYLAGKGNTRLSGAMVVSVPTKMMGKVSGMASMILLLSAPLGQTLFIGLANLMNASMAWLIFSIGSFVLFLMTLFFIVIERKKKVQ